MLSNFNHFRYIPLTSPQRTFEMVPSHLCGCSVNSVTGLIPKICFISLVRAKSTAVCSKNINKETVFISSSTFRPQAFFKKMNLKLIVTFCYLFSLLNASHVNAVFTVHCDVIHGLFWRAAPVPSYVAFHECVDRRRAPCDIIALLSCVKSRSTRKSGQSMPSCDFLFTPYGAIVFRRSIQ